jgi:hypothetical protein
MRGSPLLAGAVSRPRPQTRKTEVRGVAATAGEAVPNGEALGTQDSRQAP